MLPARLRVGSAWVDGVIHNVSSRGLLVASDDAPQPGSYLEIRRGATIIVGKVVWRKERFFGVRTQDSIDLAALQLLPQRPAPGDGVAKSAAMANRRRAERSNDAAIATRLERDRALARFFQFAVIVLAGAAASVAVAVGVYDMLGPPIARIERAMALHP